MNQLILGTERPAYENDQVLVADIAGGSKAALAEAHRRHGGPVFGLARRVCGPERAEEVTQDVFMKLWGMPQRYQPDRGCCRRSSWSKLTDKRSTDFAAIRAP